MDPPLQHGFIFKGIYMEGKKVGAKNKQVEKTKKPINHESRIRKETLIKASHNFISKILHFFKEYN